MTIDIQWLNKERSRAVVTVRPGWLGRLFGARSICANVHYDRRRSEAALSIFVTVEH